MQTRKQGTAKYQLLIAAGLTWLCFAQGLYAQEQTWKVKPNERLSDIIKQVYPDAPDRQAITDAVIAANPKAFVNGDAKKLVVGKTLKLPDTKAGEKSKAASSKTDTETTNANTDATSAAADNASKPDETAPLKDKIKDLEKERDTLKSQLDTKEQDLTTNRKTLDELQTRITELEKRAETLQTDLQTAKDAEQKALNSGRLPWIIVGLLALLMLPLLWLVKNARDKANSLAAVPLPALPLVEAPSPVMPTITKGVDAEVNSPIVEKSNTLKEEVDNPEADLKLDIARTYLEWRAPEAATDILQDVLVEGSLRQQQEAKEILSFIS